eukprot:CAMPEP_0178386814 /NCGR_PEP_ID=MMETSP0689_2-20121128/8755_1 /TAXON_ID=160604 /ORGANISM="Amphidinium massartii, Strain CS-259" /LENGTH=106 /DNA_ID=CAMNT_0020007165 /DNA_START=190 /DNA_END=510 /DNA_ORIENTATION=+
MNAKGTANIVMLAASRLRRSASEVGLEAFTSLQTRSVRAASPHKRAIAPKSMRALQVRYSSSKLVIKHIIAVVAGGMSAVRTFAVAKVATKTMDSSATTVPHIMSM